MRYPEFLPEKGTIGFVAPSFGCNTEPYKSSFNRALEKFKQLGHRVDLGPNCYEGKGIGISNTPQACAEELTSYYCSDKNDVLISVGGGELMCETIGCVDFSLLKEAAPKWYMGYSDNTNMTFLLTTLCDTAAIYAPCAQTFGMEPWDKSLWDTYELLCGKRSAVTGYERWERESLKDKDHPFAPFHLTETRVSPIFHGAEKVKETAFEGRLVGGCMDCLVNLLGTRFDEVAAFNERYKEDGIIWFMESCELNVLSIRRAVWQMMQAGWFSHVKGFLIGRPMLFGQEMMGLDQYRAVVDLLKEYQVPIVMDLDIGHLAPSMPMVSGAYANVSVQDNHVTISYDFK